MTAQAPWIGDMFLSLSAVVGLVIIHGLISARDPQDPLNRRFLFGVRVMLLLFAGRAVYGFTGFDLLRSVILFGAALIPLSVLLLAEGLLRRHAPAWGKLWIGGGTVLFMVLAFWHAPGLDPARLIGLLLFQLSGFAIGGWLVLTRNRESLTRAENRMVERIALSLVVLVPLAIADFLIVFLNLPVQISALGVLVLCLLSVSLGRDQIRHRAILGPALALIGGAGLATVTLAVMAGLDRDGVILTGAVILAAFLVVALFIEARSLTVEEQSRTLLRHLADDRSRDVLGFLRGVQAHPLVDGATVLQAADLDGLDADVLARVFASCPILRRRAMLPFPEGVERDHIDHLFARTGASHILLAGESPLCLLAVSMPVLATTPRAELELAVVQRMARLIAVNTEGPAQ